MRKERVMAKQCVVVAPGQNVVVKINGADEEVNAHVDAVTVGDVNDVAYVLQWSEDRVWTGPSAHRFTFADSAIEFLGKPRMMTVVIEDGERPALEPQS